MNFIADLIARVVIKNEETERIKNDIKSFRKGFQKIHYAFDTEKDAYQYIKIR